MNDNAQKNNPSQPNINQQLYDMDIHYVMLKDYNRMNCYYLFIRKNPWLRGKVCCDLGAGTGILSLFALLAGAKHVYIVENQKNMINKIISLLDKNSIEASRYTIMQGWSTDIELPCKVDCIIHELIGMWGNAEQGLGNLAEFRDRHLKPNGRIIPDIVEVNFTLQNTNHFYDVMHGSGFFFMGDDPINLDPLFEDLDYSQFVSQYHNKVASITDNDTKYVENTSCSETVTMTYDLLNDSYESIRSRFFNFKFHPQPGKIISLLSTLTYYCSTNPSIYGDSGKFNTNWRKQLLLFNPIEANLGDVVTGNLHLFDLPNSTIEQTLHIELALNGVIFFKQQYNTITDNKWIFDFDPNAMNDTKISLIKMTY